MSTTHPILDLWPAGPPNGWHRTDKEATERDEKQGFSIVKNVSHPTLEIFKASNATAHSPTVIVCPGGGYWIEAIEHEGTEIAERLNKAGFNAAVLKYRLPNRDQDKPLAKAPIEDAQRAIRLVRSHAEEFKIDPKMVGIMGFSAGGHLAAAVSNLTEWTYPSVDSADALSAKPAFTVLIYPAYLDTDGRPELASDVHVTAVTPPAFIAQTMDDQLVTSAFAYAIACHKVAVPVELHLFPKGGHGYGIRTKEPGLSHWIDLLIDWLARVMPDQVAAEVR